MMRLLLAVSAMVFAMTLQAQLLTWSPNFPVENDPAQSLVITVDATKGNRGLLNYNPDDVYVHLGVVTSQSAGNWRYDKFTWGTTPPAAKAVSLGGNKWQFTITGSLRSYFNVPAGEVIQKVAILFRNGEGSNDKVQRNADGSNMYIPVYSSAMGVRLLEPAMQPLFNPLPENQSLSVGTQQFKIAVNKPGTVTFDAGTGSPQTVAVNNEHTFTANFTSSGFYNIRITATDGTTSATIEVPFTVGTISSPTQALPAGLKDGINYGADHTSVTLVLHAPGKNLVTVIGDFNNWTESSDYVMYRTPDGNKFWIRLTGLTPGTEYAFQYKVDNQLKIADPYTEKVLDPWNDHHITQATYPGLKPYPVGKTDGIVSVLQTAAPGYNWTVTSFNRPDKRGLVIYEVLLRDFLHAHDWKTLSDTLNYLKNLGVNAIELMPFNEFEGNISWGYNSSFYFAPDKYYGTKNALKAFIDTAHKKGFAVIMDLVLNHTYGASPLAQLYWDNQNNRPAADNPWYNTVAPHTAISFGDDFNHEREATKNFFNRVLQHWITEYKIDGYRLDFTKGLTQKPTNSDHAFSAYDASRIAIINGYANAIRAADPNAYIILEHLADNQEEKELADNGMLLWASVWTQYQEAAMGWLDNSNFSNGIHSARGWNQPHLVTFMESHDEERVMYKTIKYGNTSGTVNIRDTAQALKRMELAGAFLFTIPGPKMIWQFGELGYDYSRCYLSSNNDESGNCDKKLDPKPIRWDYLGQARRKQLYDAFSSQIKLRFHPWYKDLFQTGTISQSLSGGYKWIQVNSGDSSRLMVIGNFGVNPVTVNVSFPVSGAWYDYMNNTMLNLSSTTHSIALQPGEYRIYVNRNVNNITTTPVVNIPTSGTTLEAKVFPNPIRLHYTVELYVPQSGNTKMDLYNVNGQFVTSVYNQFLIKGKHQVSLSRQSFDVPAGAYFIKIQTKESQKTIQVTLQ